MYRQYVKHLALVVLCLLSLLCQGKEFLRPEEAFKVQGKLTEQGLQVTFSVVPGYYIYQESLQVQAQVDNKLLTLSPESLPSAHEKYDENFQKIVRTYTDTTTLSFSLSQLPKQTPLNLEVQVQGCAEKGICYPPMTRYIQINQYDTSVPSVASLEDLSQSTNICLLYTSDAADE